jgi:two-component system chemotaxis response regulator CheB
VSPIRVLIVDDSMVTRKLLGRTIAADGALEVVGAASLGRMALEMIPRLHPGVVILDVEMPEMDGLETLSAIRESWPGLPVIMFSSRTERGAAATIEALVRGASDYVAKPSDAGSVALAVERVREELIPKIKAIAPRGRRAHQGVAQPGAGQAGPAPPVELLAIGASTGGPSALSRTLPQLRADLPVPVVIVQHMLAEFVRHFVARLVSLCSLRVSEAAHGEVLRPGHVYVCPGDYHALVNRHGREGILTLNQAAPQNFSRPAVDVMFESAARAYGASVLAVVLTGMGQDGLRGAGLIRRAGGNVLAQNEASSVVWGMPGCVVGAGLASEVLSIEEMAGEIERLVARPLAPRSPGGDRAAARVERSGRVLGSRLLDG